MHRELSVPFWTKPAAVTSLIVSMTVRFPCPRIGAGDRLREQSWLVQSVMPAAICVAS